MVRIFSLVALLATGVVSATAIEESGKHLRTVKHAGKHAHSLHAHSHAAAIRQHFSVDAGMKTVQHKDKLAASHVAKQASASAKTKVEKKAHHLHQHVEKTITTANISQKSHHKVHKMKHKHMRVKHGKQDPAGDAADQPGSVKSVADQVKELGKEMCKGRENDPKCEMFKEKTEELEEVVEEQLEEKAEEKKEEAPHVEPGTPAAEPAPPVEVPSQGFHGKKVKHVDNETKVDDWAKEYPKAYPWSVYIAWFLGIALVFLLLVAFFARK